MNLSSNSTIPDYEEFASFYDAFFGKTFLRGNEAVLTQALLPYAPGKRLLDAGCGPGHVAEWFTDRGFHVTAIDTSPAMLELAREHYQNGTFILADARSYIAKKAFDVVISTSDTLNHILDEEGLKTAFRNFFASLRAPGLLFFDLNMREGYEIRWQGSYCLSHRDMFVGIDRSFDSRTNLARFAVTAFQCVESRSDYWVRSDAALLQRCYTTEFVEQTLSEVGFLDIERFDTRKDFGLREVGRQFFRCFKRHK